MIVVGTTALIWCQRIVQNKLTTQRDINAAIFATGENATHNCLHY